MKLNLKNYEYAMTNVILDSLSKIYNSHKEKQCISSEQERSATNHLDETETRTGISPTTP